MTSRFNESPHRVYAATVGIWSVAVCCHAAWFIYAALSKPMDSDLYAHTWQFQAVAFVLVKLPYWLMAIISLLVAEFFVFGRKATQA